MRLGAPRFGVKAMTIAAAYLTSEGVVLGADSTTTVTNPAGGQVQVVQLLNHAQKVFQVGERSRIGFCTWGTGKFGTVSHRTLAAQLSEQQGFATFTVAQAAQALMGMVLAARAAANVNDVTGYFLGGWDLVTHQPQCFRLVFQPSSPWATTSARRCASSKAGSKSTRPGERNNQPRRRGSPKNSCPLPADSAPLHACTAAPTRPGPSC
jgi:hypothetical protein